MNNSFIQRVYNIRVRMSQNSPSDTTFQISSTVFKASQTIPDKYTYRGENINPPLQITGVPPSAKSLALIMHDPDAPNGNWVHWLVWNINSKTTKIAENTGVIGIEGTTSFGKPGYGGPCPPSGTHHYIFDLYALSEQLNLPANTTDTTLENTIKNITISTAQLIGLVSA